jgi:hypothetical protein
VEAFSGLGISRQSPFYSVLTLFNVPDGRPCSLMSSEKEATEGDSEGPIGAPLTHAVSLDAVSVSPDDDRIKKPGIQGIDDERYTRFTPRRKRAIVAILSYTCFLARPLFSPPVCPFSRH